MSIFKFKYFDVNQADSAMKIGTDAMVFGTFIHAEGKQNALDIGTGTGVLSLMVAQKNPELQIQAIEIEQRSAEEAALNFRKSPFQSQLQVLNQDFLQLNAENKFDLIFSNPPYFENSSKSGIENRNLARHDDSLPLNLLFQKVAELLSRDGHFWLILPNLTMDQYYPESAKNHLFPEIEISVFGKENQMVRKITAFSKVETNTSYIDFTIRKLDGTYTDSYKEYTKEYHFNTLK